MADLAYEINLAAARLARAACDAVAERSPAGRAGSWAPSDPRPGRRPSPPTSTTPAPATSRSTSSSRPTRAGARSRRRWRRRAPRRDDLRHAQRQGGDLRPRDPLRGAGPALAGHRLRDDHRRLRPHPVGPGDRGLLELGAARPPARRRSQLCAGSRRAAALRRRAVADRRLLRVGLPQRGAAERLRRVRRDAGPDGVGRRRVRVERAWSTSSAAAAGRRRSTSGPSPRPRRRHGPRASRDAPALRLSGLEPLRRRRGLPLRQRRRAHQHHRVRALPSPHQGGGLPHRALRRPPAGGGRRAGHRRQHGRGDDRRRRRDGPLRQARRQRARHLPGPAHDRLEQVGGHRDRPQVLPGQADRQLDLDEGGRRALPRPRPAGRKYGAAVVVMAFDEEGQADSLERRKEICDGPTTCSRTRSGFPATTSSSTPTSSRSPRASRSTRHTARTSSRRRAGSRRTCPARSSPAASPTCLPFRGNNPVREAIHAVFLFHAIRAGMDMGIVNAGALSSSTTSTPSCASHRGRRAQPAARLHRAAPRDRRGVPRHRRGGRPGAAEWRALPVRERITHALVKGIDDFVVDDTEELRPRSTRPAGSRSRSSRARSWTA